jgi:hypothetical protein
MENKSDFLSEMKASKDPYLFVVTEFEARKKENFKHNGNEMTAASISLQQIFSPDFLKRCPQWKKDTAGKIIDRLWNENGDELRKWYQENTGGIGGLDTKGNWKILRIVAAIKKKIHPKNKRLAHLV